MARKATARKSKTGRELTGIEKKRAIQKLLGRIHKGHVLRGLTRSILSGKFYRKLDGIALEPDFLNEDLEPAEETPVNENGDEWEPDEDWQSHREDDDSLPPPEEEFEIDTPSDFDIIANIVADKLADMESIPSEWDFDELVDIAYSRLEGADTPTQDGQTEEFITDCLAAFSALADAESRTPTTPHYIHIKDEPSLHWEIVGEPDERVERLFDNYDYSYLLELEADARGERVTGQELKEDYSDYLASLEVIADKLIDLHADFFKADDLISAKQTLFEKHVTSWQLLDTDKDTGAPLMSMCYAEVPVVCKHDVFPLKSFYINSRAPSYRLYLPALFIEEILLSPLLIGGRRKVDGLYTISEFKKRLETVIEDNSIRESVPKSRTSFYNEFVDEKRHKGKRSIVDIYMGAHTDCRRETVNYIWDECLTHLKKGVEPALLIEQLQAVYAPVLKECRKKENRPKKKPELFDAERHLYFKVVSATIEMLHRLVNSEAAISVEHLRQEIEGALGELLDKEGIVSACPDYFSDKNQQIIQQMLSNLGHPCMINK